MKDVVQRFKLGVVALLIFSLLLPSGLLVQPNPARAAELINLAFGKTVKASTSSNAASNGPEKAVDGNTGTSWNSNSKDLSPWLQVDFGGVQTFNEVKLNWRPNNVKEMKVQYLSDSSVWTDVYVVRNAFPNSTVTDTIDFDAVSSSSIRIQLHFDSKNFQLYELQVYNNPTAVPPAEKLSSIVLTDAGQHEYNENEVVSLAAGGTKSFLLKGKLDNGNDAVLSSATNFFKSSDPSIASVDKNGNVTAIKDGKTTLTAEAIVGGVLKGITIPLEVYDPVAQSNIALNKSATASSGNAAFAVDGTNTGWVPSTADATDDKQSSLIVNLGETYSYNRSTIRFTESDKLSGYTIQASEDGSVWKDVYTKTGTITTNESVIFPKTSANYVRLQLHHLSAGSAVAEFELYGGLLDILNNINFFDAMKTYQLNDTIYLNKGNTKTLQLKGNLTRNLEENDLSKATVSFESKNTKVATIDANGKITAVEEGVVLIVGKASLNEKTVYISIWVDVTNPNKDLSPLIADLQLSHSDMKMEIGQPALVNIGAAYPAVTVNPYVNASVSAELVRNGNEIIQSIAPNAVQTGIKHTIAFDGSVGEYGNYQIRLTVVTGSKTVYDTFYFTVLDPQAIPTDQSSIVYMGPDNKLIYIPDFKGNRVLDFSNVGYKGGGVKLPEAPVKVTVEPIQGDATQLIQEAIDQVSAMPEVDGIRGAVLLKKGRYEVGGTLKIQTGGVVLRGEGQDEAGGTVIYGSGTKARSLIEVGNSTGLQIDTSTATEITDMFVPSGARTFRVADASKYNVGDTVIVRRAGNQSWIHETEMDKIYDRPDRPDAVPGSTSQMTPFNLDFDRVIDKIEGNMITVDAPIANSIELRWGGGQLLKYSDPSRIQNVGVEYMYVDSAFDPSIIDTVMDNDTTDPYLADENHVEEFVVMNGLKNGWVRNITAKHLAYSLVKIDRNAKWVTVQDSKITDFVSIITGGRRYAYYFVGQLNLVQRSYSESERHAFVFDSRIPGPNVIHDSESQKNYNSSEPHHRWSTGGLFDKVKGHIVIRDRAWLGSGHAWAGANYVTWNTEGILTSQQPPTAQNYAIGHVGTKGTPLVPNEYDPRPRNDAYWDHPGTHVKPDSLYLQQLQDRLGQEAVDNIKPPLTAPSGLTATAGDAQVSLKWNSVTGATYYNVKRSTTPGTGYATVASNVANNSYTDSGLQYGSTYYYVVSAANSAYESSNSNEASVTLSRSGRGNGGGGGSSAGGGGTSNQPSEAGSQVLRVEPVIGKAADGRGIASIEVDASALSKALEAIAAGGSGAAMPKLTIEAGSADASTAIFRLPAQQLADIAAAGSGLVISFQYGNITYELPVKAINFAELAKSLGAPWNDVLLVVTLENVNDTALSAMKDKANQAGLTLLAGAGAIEFKVGLESKGKTVNVDDFGLNYVSRKMNIGKPKDLSRTTAVTYDPATGQFRFVPALFTEGSEGTQVTIKRPGNSIYTVVESSKTFADLTKHWSQSDVELLASKLVVNGMTESSFAPDNRITRAEFAAILVRGLGLNEASAAKFTDVKPSDWHAGAVGAAAKAGLVDGFEDGTFKPNANITREQMALMAARAMTIVGKKASADAKGLAVFNDSSSVSSWAKEAAAQVVNAGIMNGKTGSAFVPGENASRAEAAVMVKRLLQYAQLMN